MAHFRQKKHPFEVACESLLTHEVSEKSKEKKLVLRDKVAKSCRDIDACSHLRIDLMCVHDVRA